MLGVHVRLDLEDEARELLLHRLHGALVGHTRQRARRPVHHGVEDVIDAEVTQRGAEEHRGHLTVDELLLVEFVAGTLDQLELLEEALVLVPQVRARLVGVEFLDDPGLGAFMTMARGVDNDVVAGEVVNAFEITVATDRPGDRRSLDLEDGFDFVEQFDRVADITVEFVCLLYTSPSPRDATLSRMPSSA